MNSEILLMPEVSELTRVPMSTLRFYRHSGQGPRSFLLGGRVAYKRSDVTAWVESQYATATGGDANKLTASADA
jgi:predicted DNA-binding transcriptional regulator AlpA